LVLVQKLTKLWLDGRLLVTVDNVGVAHGLVEGNGDVGVTGLDAPELGGSNSIAGVAVDRNSYPRSRTSRYNSKASIN
jgi:hypothetical protein